VYKKLFSVCLLKKNLDLFTHEAEAASQAHRNLQEKLDIAIDKKIIISF